MNDESMELLSAVLDGEDVDPKRLAEAMTDPGARELLRDFALLRSAVREDLDPPGDAFYERMEHELSNDPSGKIWWKRVVPIPVPAMAAVLLVGVLLGVWAILPSRMPSRGLVEQPPEPDRVVEFVEGVDWTVWK